MEDKNDKLERLNYLEGEKRKQDKRKNYYLQQIEELKKSHKFNDEEIVYNKGWVKFHENSIVGHQKAIKETVDLDKKIDQEKKLKFHQEQIENHHKKNIEYHKKELEALKKETELFEQGINRCEGQIKFLEVKIKENSS